MDAVRGGRGEERRGEARETRDERERRLSDEWSEGRRGETRR
jgi:hypothetical protein